jgi:DNA (cytosine-5)-methyltransferase 1
MKVVDLFAGCGGLSLGFETAGFSVVAAYDWWDPAIAVYSANFDGHPITKLDLTDVEASVAAISEYSPEMIIGGPPCQDFSHAGKRSEGDRANLTIAFAEIISAVQPSWFVMENVERAQKSLAFKEAIRLFHKAGYGITAKVLDASYCGVPQKRKRFFCIGKLGEKDDFLLSILEKRQSKSPMTVRDYLGDSLGIAHYYRHPRNYSRRAIFSIDEPAPTMRGVNRPIPAGYKRHAGDVVDPKVLRPLTTEERARIQTFPEKFKWFGTKTDKEQMIGNAVPVALASFVANCILKHEGKTLKKGRNENGRRRISKVAGKVCSIGRAVG